MNGSDEKALRNQLLELLDGREAHIDLETALSDFPVELYGARLEGAPYTAWQLLEHMRITLWDIVEFTRDPHHQSPSWPEGYWTAAEAPPTEDVWHRTKDAIERLMLEMKQMVRNTELHLFAPIPHGTGQTLLREALLVADHNAYHLGQLVMLRKTLEKRRLAR